MPRAPSEIDVRTTAELDRASLRDLLDHDAREQKPTTLMKRDELLELVQATAPVQPEPVEDDERSVSPLLVLAMLALFIGLFAAIVLSA